MDSIWQTVWCEMQDLLYEGYLVLNQKVLCMFLLHMLMICLKIYLVINDENGALCSCALSLQKSISLFSTYLIKTRASVVNILHDSKWNICAFRLDI